MKKPTQAIIHKTLDWAYEKAIKTVPEMAEDYISKGKEKNKTNTEIANSVIRWQNSKAGTSGFITGLGGVISIPLGIPANLASVWYVQIKMIAVIAYIGGYDLKDDRVKSLIFICLTGNSAKDILKDLGVTFGEKMTTQMIKNISGKTLIEINKKVGFRLFTKFGEKGVINLGKLLPLVGGVIGLLFDSITTNTIGNIARKTFIEKEAIASKK